jgi:hypothetical protein
MMDINTEAVALRNVVTMGARGIVAECATPMDAIRVATCLNACRGTSTYALRVGIKPMSQITRGVETALARLDDARSILKAIGS